MEFSRPEYWCGYPLPSPGDLPNSGIQPRTLPHCILYLLSHKGSPRILEWLLGFPDSSVGQESACNAGDSGLIPGLGRSTGEGIFDLRLVESRDAEPVDVEGHLYLQ